MRAWAINVDAFDEQAALVTLKGRRKPRIGVRDVVVLFRRPWGDEVSFLAVADVMAVNVEEVVEEDETPSSLFLFEARLSTPTPLDPPRPLTALAYSLQKVRRFGNPGRHFGRVYVALPKDDLDVIVDGRVFWARTAFGLYVNELPEDALARFVSELSARDGACVVGGGSFARLWENLKEFIQGEYVAAAEVFRGITSLAADLTASGIAVPYEAITVGDDGSEGSPDRIVIQNSLLDEFITGIADSDAVGPGLLQELDQRVASGENQDWFEQKFGGSPWPLQRMRV